VRRVESSQATAPGATVGRVLDAYNDRDLERLLACFRGDVEWHTTPGFLWPGPYRGREALRSLFERWWEGWQRGHADQDELVEQGDRAMVSACLRGRSAGDGLDVEVRLNWIFTVRDGLVVLVQSYETPEEARAAL
jgi:ketosteroid isomerase-like protein